MLIMDMSIAAMSVDMHMAQTQQSLGIAVMKMAMEDGTSMMEEALEAVGSLEPELGNNIDVSV